jgi:hypothetical protein
MNEENIQHKIDKYVCKLKHAVNTHEADGYHRKLRYYHRLNQYGDLCSHDVEQYKTGTENVSDCILKEILHYENILNNKS